MCCINQALPARGRDGGGIGVPTRGRGSGLPARGQAGLAQGDRAGGEQAAGGGGGGVQRMVERRLEEARG